MNATVARLTARNLLAGRRALLLVALPVVLLVLAVVARAVAPQEAAGPLAVTLLGGFALGTLVPLLGLIAGTGSIGPEIDDGSIVYLLSKPLSRDAIVVTKVVVAVAVVTALGAVPTLAAGVVLTGAVGGLALGYAAGAAVAGAAYCALFVLLAVLTRNAVVLGLVYALVWETVVGQLVPGAQALSVQQWSLAVTELVAGDAAAVQGVDSAVGLTPAVALLFVVTLAGTWYAGQRLRTLRLTSDA